MLKNTECLSKENAIRITPEGKREELELDLLRQKAFILEIDGNEIYRFVTLPGYIKEMVTGFLISEGYAFQKSEVVILEETDSFINVHIQKENRTRVLKEKVSIQKEDIFKLATAFKKDMPLHDKTFMTHSALLMHEGKIIFSCEDLGRHNALDKAIGFALLNNKCLSECFVYMSGRLQKDAVEKAARVNLSALVSKAGATKEAVCMAKEKHLTLVAKARPDEAYILADQEVL